MRRVARTGTGARGALSLGDRGGEDADSVPGGSPPVKVLMTAGRFPYPPDSGGSLRVYHLLRLLASRHTIRLIAAHTGYVAPDHVEHLRSLGVESEIVPIPRRGKGHRFRNLLTSAVPALALHVA